MNNAWRVKAILALLSGLTLKDAHAVLCEAKQQLEIKKVTPEVEKPVCPNAYRQPRQSKIERDDEVKALILSLPYMNQAEVIRACERQFGASRTPSRSGLHRFLQNQRSIK